MSKLISEHFKSKLRSSIPLMARNIHEGFFGNLIQSGKEMIKDRWKRAGHDVLDRQEKIRNEVLYPHYAQKMGINTKELHRLLHEVPSIKPSAPLTHIPDPNHPVGSATPAPLVANPHWKDEMSRYMIDLDDWKSKQKALTTISGINSRDRNIGRTYERIMGGRPDPRSRSGGTTPGIVNIVQSRI